MRYKRNTKATIQRVYLGTTTRGVRPEGLNIPEEFLLKVQSLVAHTNTHRIVRRRTDQGYSILIQDSSVDAEDLL